jgi:anthranilate phosphoribosyltransferase
MKDILTALLNELTLSRQQTIDVFEQIMTGQAHPAAVGALLALIQQRGPSVEELTGAATVMRSKVTRVTVPEDLIVIDTCGTGGDHAGTFNISTAAAIVAAGAGRSEGVVVAKHGNRSVTSKSGSSQVLEVLGVKLLVSGETLTQCLDQAGLCFCFAQAHHPAMKHAAPIRAALGIPTLFNLLGPLTNPAGATRQVMGVFSHNLTEPVAQVLANLGTEYAMVVHGKGVDELITWGKTRVSTVYNDGTVRTTDIEPADLGIKPARLEHLQVDSPAGSAAVIEKVLAGETGPARDIVCLNAGAALLVGGAAKDLATGYALAQHAIDSGKARNALDNLVAITQADAS